jgi:hypothetical protein
MRYKVYYLYCIDLSTHWSILAIVLSIILTELFQLLLNTQEGEGEKEIVH